MIAGVAIVRQVPMEWVRGLAVVLALCAAPTGLSAQETGSVQEGQRMAREVCASCHAVENDDAFSPVFPAPTFVKVANTPGMTATALSVVLRTPHRTMPDLILKSDELSNITAYILSLRDQ
jgi:mono/diheme cytochrome c family protein